MGGVVDAPFGFVKCHGAVCPTDCDCAFGLSESLASRFHGDFPKLNNFIMTAEVP